MIHVDNQKNIKNDINSLEKRFPVNEWQVNGIHVWPYIRIVLYFLFINKFKST
jgi:hypothetical protein